MDRNLKFISDSYLRGLPKVLDLLPRADKLIDLIRIKEHRFIILANALLHGFFAQVDIFKDRMPAC